MGDPTTWPNDLRGPAFAIRGSIAPGCGYTFTGPFASVDDAARWTRRGGFVARFTRRTTKESLRGVATVGLHLRQAT